MMVFSLMRGRHLKYKMMSKTGTNKPSRRGFGSSSSSQSSNTCATVKSGPDQSSRVKMNVQIVALLLAVWTVNGRRVPRQGFIDLGADRCTNPKGEPGVCMPIRKCSTLVTLLITHRQQAEVKIFLRQSVCGYDGGDPKVCCPAESEKTTQFPTIKPKSAISTTPEPSTSNPIRDNVSLQSAQLPKICGKSNPQHFRVVGGVNASLGAWPWMAALGYKSSKGGDKPSFLCAGSLISDKHILTAAHCLPKDKKLLLVRLGDLNLYDDREDGATPVNAGIARTIVHEKYDARTFTNDIALIELDKPVAFNKNIQPICLPLSREMRSRDFLSRKPFVAGWGSVSFAGPSSPTLMELQVPVLEETACRRAFEPFKTALIDRRILCAGYLTGGKDACRGDSGGPLMDPADSLFYQIGIVSYGYKCAEPGFPGVYTRVTEFVDWIVNKIDNK